MVEDKPTVCVSFTPRDEAAALRVASALREAGIEVVLSSEGGSEAVESCDLFLPIISDNTQSQASGRFRNEWQRAAQRAEAMSDDTTFLLPVVVDGTANREAKVPDVFRGRPWLRFEVWGSSSPLVARVEAMLERRSTAQADAAEAQRAAAEAEAKSSIRRWIKRLPRWVRRLRIVWIVSFVVLPGGVIAWRIARAPARPIVERRAEPSPVPASPVSKTAEDDPAPFDLKVVQPVDEPRPQSARAPVTGRETSSYSNRGHDLPIGRVRNEPLRSSEERAGGPLKDWEPQPLVPRSRNGDPLLASATATGTTLAKEIWAVPLGDGTAASPEARRSMEADLPAPRSSGNPVAERAVNQALLALWQGDPTEAVEDLAPIEDEWIDCEVFTGPPSLLRGLCQDAQREQRGVAESSRLARESWLHALAIIQTRRASRPDEVELALVEAQVRALLGQEVDALDDLRTYDDSAEGKANGPQREHLIVWAVLGDYAALMDEVVVRFRDGKQRWAEVHNWLRYDPRFAAWRQRMSASESTTLN